MQEEMILQIGLLTKASLTNMTLEGPSACMHISMRFEIARSREAFGTHGALMRFFLKDVIYVNQVDLAVIN